MYVGFNPILFHSNQVAKNSDFLRAHMQAVSGFSNQPDFLFPEKSLSSREQAAIEDYIDTGIVEKTGDRNADLLTALAKYDAANSTDETDDTDDTDSTSNSTGSTSVTQYDDTANPYKYMQNWQEQAHNFFGEASADPGKISITNLEKLGIKGVASWDTNKDGYLTTAELETVMQNVDTDRNQGVTWKVSKDSDGHAEWTLVGNSDAESDTSHKGEVDLSYYGL